MNNTEVSKVEVVGDVSIKGDSKKEATGKLILDLAKIFLVGAVANEVLQEGSIIGLAICVSMFLLLLPIGILLTFRR